MSMPTRERIAEVAYLLYIEEGRPEGKADGHWRRAEEILAADHLPSDPHSGPEAYHQQVTVAVDRRNDRTAAKAILKLVQALRGVESADLNEEGTSIKISFDARRTNPAAVFDAIEASRKAEDVTESFF
jgi:Protein of unknown function (DUF2934)